jgi:hypothetical protein
MTCVICGRSIEKKEVSKQGSIQMKSEAERPCVACYTGTAFLGLIIVNEGLERTLSFPSMSIYYQFIDDRVKRLKSNGTPTILVHYDIPKALFEFAQTLTDDIHAIAFVKFMRPHLQDGTFSAEDSTGKFSILKMLDTVFSRLLERSPNDQSPLLLYPSPLPPCTVYRSDIRPTSGEWLNAINSFISQNPTYSLVSTKTTPPKTQVKTFYGLRISDDDIDRGYGARVEIKKSVAEKILGAGEKVGEFVKSVWGRGKGRGRNEEVVVPSEDEEVEQRGDSSGSGRAIKRVPSKPAFGDEKRRKSGDALGEGL